MKTELLRVCDALVTAGLNGVLQGLLLLVLLLFGLRWFGRRLNATTRHAVYLVTLLFLALLIPAHGLRHFLARQKPSADQKNRLAENIDNQLAQPRRASNSNGGETELPAQASKPAPLNFVFLPLPPEQQSTMDSASGQFGGLVQIQEPTNVVYQAPGPVSFDRPNGFHRSEFLKFSEAESAGPYESHSLFGSSTDSAARSRSVSEARGSSSEQFEVSRSESNPATTAGPPIPPLAQAIIEAASAIEATATDKEPTIWDNLKGWMAGAGAVLLDPASLNLTGQIWLPAKLSVYIVGGCVLLAAYRLGLVAFRLRKIRQIKAGALEPTPELDGLFRQLLAETKATRTASLGLSPTQRSAVLLGFRRPKILLPAGCDLREAEPVLRHELAHLNRRDDWANLCQQLIHAAFFYHPGVWWLCRQLSLEREIACDDCVLKKSTPRGYALLLATLAGRMQGSPALLAPGVSTNKSQLKQRIDMILDTHRNTSVRVARTRLGLITSAAGFLALAAIYVAPRIVLAQSQPVAPTAPSVPVAAVAPTPTRTLAPVAPVGPALAAETIVADEPGTATPPAVSTGPKYKTLTPAPVPAVPAPPATLSSAAGVIALTPAPGAPQARMALVAPGPGSAPLIVTAEAPGAPDAASFEPRRRKDTSNMSIEERLDRLEKMIESLSAKREYKVWQPDFKWETQPKMNGLWDPKQTEQIKEFARQQADMARKQVEIARQQLEAARQNAVNPKEIEKLKAEIDRQTAHAGEEMKRAARELDRAMREQPPRPKQPEGSDAAPRKRKMEKNSGRQQLEGLRRQHEALERQMERLDRQIEEIEQSQEDQDEQDEKPERESADLQGFPKGAQNIEVAVDQPKQECSDNKNVNVNADVNARVSVNADAKPKK